MDFHSGVFNDPEDLADWIELFLLVDDAGELALPELVDRLQNSDLIVPSDEFESGRHRDIDEHSDVNNAEWALDALAQAAWNILKRRHATAKGPFRVTRQTASRRATAAPASCFLSFCEVGRFYDGVRVAFESGSIAPDLFEEIVCASQKGLFRGQSVVFPANGSSGWSSNVKERLAELAERFDRELHDLSSVSPDDNDLGLDVASRFSFGEDEAPGTIVVLTQCATGANWRTKSGTPAIALWRDIIGWHAPIVKAIAIPWQVRPGCPGLKRGVKTREGALRRYTRFHNDAIVLDRIRLCAGAPDEHLDDTTAKALQKWCEERKVELLSA